MLYSPLVRVLNLENLTQLVNQEIVIFGSGSTSEEFLDLLYSMKIIPKKITILDSYSEGYLRRNHGEFKVSKMTGKTSIYGILIIASCQWQKILETWQDVFPQEYWLISNELMHLANPIASLEQFYLSSELIAQKNHTKTLIMDKFFDSNSQELYDLVFGLRTGMQEKVFMEEVLKRLGNIEESETKYSFLNNVGKFDFIIDGGIYDGSEIPDLIAILSENGEYHGLDPNLKSIESEFHNLTKESQLIRFHKTALWDSETVLPFNSERGAASALLTKQDMDLRFSRNVVTTSLNSHFKGIKGKRCLVKLDVEGAEMRALQGGIDFFKENSIVFAISLYHRASDLINIPEFIFSLNKDFHIKIGISNPTFIDWVLYAFER